MAPIQGASLLKLLGGSRIVKVLGKRLMQVLAFSTTLLLLFLLAKVGYWQMPLVAIADNSRFETRGIGTNVQHISMKSQNPGKTVAYYSEVFDRTHASLERWHVIRPQHILDAIDVVAQEGQGMRSYLIKLAREDHRSHGWPYWALLCGSLAKIGGEDARAMLIELAENTNAPLHAREWAERALDGQLFPNHQSYLRRQTAIRTLT